MPFGRRSPPVILSCFAVSALVPVGLVLRFGLPAPLPWMLPGLRRIVTEGMPAPVIIMGSPPDAGRAEPRHG